MSYSIGVKAPAGNPGAKETETKRGRMCRTNLVSVRAAGIRGVIAVGGMRHRSWTTAVGPS
jgi:hypothetical protein